MSLVESRSHIIHVIPSDKMTAKNDLQTEYVYNSVVVIEALVVILGACRSLELQETCHQTWNRNHKKERKCWNWGRDPLEWELGAELQFKRQSF